MVKNQGILFIAIYFIVGIWLFLVQNHEAALQWFRSAFGYGMLLLLEETKRYQTNGFVVCMRFRSMLVLILLSIGLHALIGVFDLHSHWLIKLLT